MTILFRFEAGAAVGLGHGMRCLALAEALQSRTGTQAILASMGRPLEISERAKKLGIKLTTMPEEQPGSRKDALATVEMAREGGSRWIIVDGYRFGQPYLAQIREEGFQILLIDDYGQAGYEMADLVLNPNLYAGPALYPALQDRGRLLLGPRYALLRQEFRAYSKVIRETRPQARTLTITLGGGDAHDLTSRILRHLQKHPIKNLEVQAVMGGSARTLPQKELPAWLRILPSPPDMAKILAESDLAITAGGGTCLECAFMGIPNLIIPIADNQMPVARQFQAVGAGINLGWFEDLEMEKLHGQVAALAEDQETRRAMAAAGKRLVDGSGSIRLATTLAGRPLTLKPAGMEDAKQIWMWANDPVARAMSLTSEPIPWEQHLDWYGKRLGSGRTEIFIGLDHLEGAIGQVRFDTDAGEEATISIIVDKRFRGQGHGANLVREGLEQMRAIHGTCTFHAWAEISNLASRRLFEACGFVQAESKGIHGREFCHFVLGNSSCF